MDTSSGPFTASFHLNDELENILRAAWADAYMAGGKDGSDQGSTPTAEGLAHVVAEIDWSSWKPGNARTAALLAGPTGFDELLADAGIVLQGIERTLRKDIGKVLEQALAEGWAIDRTTKEITQIIKDPVRAKTIAVTEINRAMSLGSYQVYKANGWGWNLITMPGACPVHCLPVKAKNPHPITDTRIPPLHPRCRCGIAAHVLL